MKKILIFLFCITLVLSTSIGSFAAEQSKDDDIYKLEKVYKFDEESRLRRANNENESLYSEIKDIEKNLKQPGKVVSAKTIEVYVKEKIDTKTNEIIESRLMTNKEVKEFLREKRNTVKSRRGEMVDHDSETKQKLELRFYAIDYGDYYHLLGRAEWDVDPYSLDMLSGYSAPSSGEDFIAITWGGDGEFKKIDYDIDGEYALDSGDISFYRAKSDSYGGYCWSFKETKSSSMVPTMPADYIKATVDIKKTYSSMKNKETNAKLTYIHTYEKTVGSVYFSPLAKKLAPQVNLQNVDKSWSLEVDCEGLIY